MAGEFLGQDYLNAATSGLGSLGSGVLSTLGGAASTATGLATGVLGTSYNYGAGAGNYLSSLTQPQQQQQVQPVLRTTPTFTQTAPTSLGSFGSSFNMGSLTGRTSPNFLSNIGSSALGAGGSFLSSLASPLVQRQPTQSLAIQPASSPTSAQAMQDRFNQMIASPSTSSPLGILSPIASAGGTAFGKAQEYGSGALRTFGDVIGTSIIPKATAAETKGPSFGLYGGGSVSDLYPSAPSTLVPPAPSKSLFGGFDIAGKSVSEKLGIGTQRQPIPAVPIDMTTKRKDVGADMISSALSGFSGFVKGFDTTRPTKSSVVVSSEEKRPVFGQTFEKLSKSPYNISSFLVAPKKEEGIFKKESESPTTKTAASIAITPSEPIKVQLAGGKVISYQDQLAKPSEEFLASKVSGYTTGLGDSRTLTLIGKPLNDGSGGTIDTIEQALEYQRQEALAGKNPDVLSGKSTITKAATFYQNELDKAMQNKIRLSSDIHHVTKDLDVSIARNPWENQGDVALAFLKAGGKDDFTKDYSWNKGVTGETGILGFLPRGLGSQETAWNAAIARDKSAEGLSTKILGVNYQPAIASVLAAGATTGPYGALQGRGSAADISALPIGYQEALSKIEKGETTKVGTGTYTIPRLFTSMPTTPTATGSTFEKSAGIPISQIKPEISAQPSVQTAPRKEGDIIGNLTDFFIPRASAAEGGVGSTTFTTVGGEEASKAYAPAVLTPAQRLSSGDIFGSVIGVHKEAAGKAVDIGKTAAFETAQQTAGFGLSVLDQMPFIGAPATDVVIGTFGKSMGASKEGDRYGSYSRVSSRIGKELQNITGLRASELKYEAEKPETGLLEKVGYSAAASTLESPGQIPSAIESGLIMGGAFGKLGQVASPYLARIGTKLTGTGAGGTKLAIGATSKYVPMALMGLGLVAEGTEGFTEFEPGTVAVNIGEKLPTTGTQIAAMSAQEPILRGIAKQTMLFNAKTPDQIEAARTLLSLEKNIRGIKSPVEKVSEFDTSKVTNIKEAGVGDVIKDRLKKEATLLFGGAAETQMPATSMTIGGEKLAGIRKGPTLATSGTHDIDIVALARNEKSFANSLASDLEAKFPGKGYKYEPDTGLVVSADGSHIVDAHTLFGEASSTGSLASQLKSHPIAKLDYGISEVAFTGPKGEQVATIPFRIQTLNKINSMFGAPIEGGGWRFGPEAHRMKDVGQGIVDAKFMAQTAREQAAVTNNPIAKMNLNRRADQIDKDIEVLVKNPLYKDAWAEYVNAMRVGKAPTPKPAAPPIPKVKPSMFPSIFPQPPIPTPLPTPGSQSPQPTQPSNIPININLPASQIRNLPSSTFIVTQPTIGGRAATASELAKTPSLLAPAAFQNVPIAPSRLASTRMDMIPINVNIPASRVSALKTEIGGPSRFAGSEKVTTVPSSKISSYVLPSMFVGSIIPPSSPPPSEKPSDIKPSESKPSEKPSDVSSIIYGGSTYGSTYGGSPYSYIGPSTSVYESPSESKPPSSPSSPSQSSSTMSSIGSGIGGFAGAPFLAPPGGGGGGGGGSGHLNALIQNPLVGLSVAGSGKRFFNFKGINDFVRSVKGQTGTFESNIAKETRMSPVEGSKYSLSPSGIRSSLSEASGSIGGNVTQGINTPRKSKKQSAKVKRQEILMPSIKMPKLNLNTKIKGDLAIKPKKKSKKGRK